MSSKNINVPKEIKTEVLTESGYKCVVPTCGNTLAIDLHHLIHVSEEGDNFATNLLALCPYCHAMYHRGNIHKDSIKYWKCRLEALNKFGHSNIEMPKKGDNKKEFFVAVRIGEGNEIFVFPDRASRQSFLNHIEITDADYLITEADV